MLTRIQQRLKSLANPTKAAYQEKYLKNVVKAHGIVAKDLDDAFKKVYEADLKTLTITEKMELVTGLISSEYIEEKSCAIKILHKNYKDLTPEDHLPILEGYYHSGWVKEWATTDAICGKVFFELVRSDDTFSKLVQNWKSSSNLWLQRTSCVSFVKLARHGKFNEEIFDICKTTVQSSERFVQLGSGWVLRELYLAQPEEVVAFIKERYNSFSREGLRYAIEKMPKELQRELLEYGKSPAKRKAEEPQTKTPPKKKAK